MPVEKKKLAVMGFENLSKLTDATLSKKALDTVTEALHATQRFILVEREQIGVALLELNLHQMEFFKPENAKRIGEFLGADLIGVGSIKSVSQLGKTGALVGPCKGRWWRRRKWWRATTSSGYCAAGTARVGGSLPLPVFPRACKDFFEGLAGVQFAEILRVSPSGQNPALYVLIKKIKYSGE